MDGVGGNSERCLKWGDGVQKILIIHPKNLSMNYMTSSRCMKMDKPIDCR